MTREETIKILMVVQVAYPNYKPQDKTAAVNLWTGMLEDFSYQQAEAALKAYIRTDKSGFAPSIGDIVDKVQTLFGEAENNEAEAWQMVWNAIRSSGYYERAEDNFAKLPEIVQRSVGSPGQLREWALTEKLNVEVVSSNFKRTYRTELQMEKELRKLSPELLKLTGKALDEKKIETRDKPKALTVSEEREIAEKKSVPMPDKAKVMKEKLFG